MAGEGLAVVRPHSLPDLALGDLCIQKAVWRLRLSPRQTFTVDEQADSRESGDFAMPPVLCRSLSPPSLDFNSFFL